MKMTKADAAELKQKREQLARKRAKAPKEPDTLAEATEEQLERMTLRAIAALPDVDINESTITNRVHRDGMTIRRAAVAPLRVGTAQKPSHRSKVFWNSTFP